MIKINEFLKKPINKFFIWLLIGLLILLVGISSPKAASIGQVRLFGHSLDDVWAISSNGSTIANADYFLFTDGSVPNYLYADVCTTGNAPIVWVTAFGGNTRVAPDTNVYKVNKPCSVSGYSAYVYRFTFYVTSYDDAGNGNLGLQFNTRLFSNTSYNTYFRLLSITFSDSLSYSDIDLSNQENIINQNNQIISGQEDLTNSVNDVNDTLNDDTSPDTPDFSDLEVADDSVISDLVTMPITIAEHILAAFNDTCSNYTIPFFNNTTLTLPCFTIGDYVGNNVASVIDLAITLFMIYNIAMLAISAFNDLTSLRDSYDSLYVPQHGPSYEPRHGKE